MRVNLLRRKAPLAMNQHDSRVQLRELPPAGYRIRDRELPQRLLGALLWAALFIILWKVGSR
jgi:hypothetical protein